MEYKIQRKVQQKKKIKSKVIKNKKSVQPLSRNSINLRRLDDVMKTSDWKEMLYQMATLGPSYRVNSGSLK